MLWLARVELRAFSAVRVALAAADETATGEGDGCVLDWQMCAELGDGAAALRALFNAGLIACGAASATHSAPPDAPWLLRLNLVSMELSLDNVCGADRLCRRFIADDFSAAELGSTGTVSARVGGRSERMWGLWARVQRASASATPEAPAGSSSGAKLGGAAQDAPPGRDIAGESLLWKARLSEVSAAAPSRFELWHSLVLSGPRSRGEALQLIACALCDRSPDTCIDGYNAGYDVDVVRRWCSPASPRHDLGHRELLLGDSAPAAEVTGACGRLLAAHLDTAHAARDAASGGGGGASAGLMCLQLLGVRWLQLTAGPAEVQAAFEAAISTEPATGVARATLWLHYLHWARLPASGLPRPLQQRLLRRCMELPANGSPPPPGGADADAFFLCEPMRSFFLRCGRVERSTAGSAAASSGAWRWEGEFRNLAMHVCARGEQRVGPEGGPHAERRWDVPAGKGAPALMLVHLAAGAARAGAVQQARAALATAIANDPGCVDGWTL